MIRIVVYGSSGDLARRKTFPALFGLYIHGFLHGDFKIIGYARSTFSKQEYTERIAPFLRKAYGAACDNLDLQISVFFDEHCTFVSGQYDSHDDFTNKLKPLIGCPAGDDGVGMLRIHYLALPPNAFISVASRIRDCLECDHGRGGVVTRLVIEKPFGRDLRSSEELETGLKPLFDESEIYRIDHYLGKEMVKSILVLRFGNHVFESLWSTKHIASVQVTMDETLGVEGRGGYYDDYGVIRDVLQNHILQMLSIVAMERPAGLDPESIRDAKLASLKQTKTLTLKDVILGQYGKSQTGPAYTEEDTVPSGSLTPTFVMAVCYIDTDRWRGVPFILRTGKALNSSKSEIRIQFRESTGFALFESVNWCATNELVVSVQPDEKVYMRMVVRKPGVGSGMEPVRADLDLSYKNAFTGVRIPDAYENLLLEILQGEQQNFVRADELAEAWRIVTPLLEEIEGKHVKPVVYPHGSHGPAEAEEWLERLKCGCQ